MSRKAPRDRAQLRRRRNLREVRRRAAVDGEQAWADHDAAKAQRQAERAPARLTALRVQLPRGCQIAPETSSKYPYAVRVTTPGGTESIRWDPAHMLAFLPSGIYRLRPADLAGVMRNLALDEADRASAALFPAGEAAAPAIVEAVKAGASAGDGPPSE